MRLLSLLWLVGCAAVPIAPANPTPTPQPVSTPLETVEPAPEPPLAPLSVEPAGALRLSAAGPHVGRLFHGGSRLISSLEPVDEEWSSILLPISDTEGAQLRVFVRTDAPAVEAEYPTDAIAHVRGHRVVLSTEAGIPFAQVRCTALDVLRYEDGRTQVRLVDRRRGWTVSGWVDSHLEEYGRDCGARVMHSSRGHVMGPESDPDIELPEGFSRISGVAPRLRGPVWQIRRGSEGVAECQRWVFRRREGLVLERRFAERFGRRGRAVMREFQPFEGGPRTYLVYALGYQRRWIRQPEGSGRPGHPAAIGAVWYVTIVAEDAESIRWVEARDIVAYHTADVQHWFRSESACTDMLNTMTSPDQDAESP